jgi:hypothetical protein
VCPTRDHAAGRRADFRMRRGTRLRPPPPLRRRSPLTRGASRSCTGPYRSRASLGTPVHSTLIRLCAVRLPRLRGASRLYLDLSVEG